MKKSGALNIPMTWAATHVVDGTAVMLLDDGCAPSKSEWLAGVPAAWSLLEDNVWRHWEQGREVAVVPAVRPAHGAVQTPGVLAPVPCEWTPECANKIAHVRFEARLHRWLACCGECAMLPATTVL